MSYIKEAIRDLIPPERREELKKKYEKLNEEISELERKLAELRKNRLELEKLLVALGEIEKPVPPATIRGEKKAIVRRYILNLGRGAEFRFTDIVRATGQSRGTVYGVLVSMERNGEIQKIGKGAYRVVVGDEGEENTNSGVPTGKHSKRAKKKD